MDTSDWTEVKLSHEDVQEVIRAFVIAEDEGLLTEAMAKLALRLIGRMGQEVIDSPARSWFVKRLQEVVK